MCIIGSNEQEDALNRRRSLWMSAMPDSVPPDPLLKEFEDDPVIAVFRPEAFCSCETCCLTTCYAISYPLNAPSYLCAGLRMICYPGVFRQFAHSRRFILRENSLLYELEKDAPSHPMGLCCCGSESVVTEPVQILVLLSDDFTIEMPSAVMELKIKENKVALMAVSSVVEKPGGELISDFLQKVKAQVQAQAYTPRRNISKASMDQHDAILSYHQFITSVPQNTTLTQEDVARKSKDFHAHLVNKLKAIETGAPVPDDMHRDFIPTAGHQGTIVAHVAPPVEAKVVEPEPRSVLVNMSVQDVSQVLKTLGLEQYCASFEKAGVNGAMMAILDGETLAELGVTSNLDRKRILAWVLQNK